VNVRPVIRLKLTEKILQKRKPPAKVPEAVVSIDDQSKSKARRVSTDASTSTSANAPVKTVAASDSEQGDSVSDANQEDESMERIGKLIQDLFHSDNTRVKTALIALNLDLLDKDNKGDKIQAAGGCLALVQVVKDCLKKATEKIPECDRVIELDELDELQTLDTSLNVAYDLMNCHKESRVGISS
jgi:hypothetical protein